jgi:hypothetical protein
MFGKVLIATSLTLLGLLVTANVSHAQPSWPQGNGSVSGARSDAGPNYRGYYARPVSAPTTTTYESFYSPEPERSGWQKRSDGWYFYWQQGRVIGAYDPNSEAWYVYEQAAGWGKPARPPWKRR